MSALENLNKAIRDPITAYRYVHPRAFSGIGAALFSRYPIGDNVLDENWDLLIVLDTCRYDALKAAKTEEEYSWLSDAEIQSRTSVGGSTLEWTAQTFRDTYRQAAGEIDYIAGNVLVEEVLEGRRTPEEVDDANWSPTAWKTLSKECLNDFISVARMRNIKGPSSGHEDRPHPSAQLVTDLAIRNGRENDPDRQIVHYIQPHYPYYSAIESGERSELESWEVFPFPALRSGQLSKQTLWDRYMSELKLGLDAVGDLLQNYDADKVAITADHGDAFGERFFGMKGYKHRVGMLHPKVRRVPWAITSATDTESRIPDLELESDNTNRDEMLEALGYL